MISTSKMLVFLVACGQLEQVDLFGYLGSRITKEDCKDKVKTQLV